MMRDNIEEFKGSTIQHGDYNDRIYLMDAGDDPPLYLGKDLIHMAKRKGYSKIFAKVPDHLSDQFIGSGFVEEAKVPGYYNGEEDAIFMGYYDKKERALEVGGDELDEILKLTIEKANESPDGSFDERFELGLCENGDVTEMAEIYSEVFPSYPFPIRDPKYLLETMKSHVEYFGVIHDGNLIALSSAEINWKRSNVEMTDFATLPQWRGNGLGYHLLREMEKEMRRRSLKTAYTIARARSVGMNVTFARCGYGFGGRLKNNTNISGNIESMNVWYKGLQ